MKAYKLLALITSDAPWQYYNKYKNYLKDTKHPFIHRIDFYYDKQLNISPKLIRQYAAVAFYHHDPLQTLYPAVYAYAKHIEAICSEAGIPFINNPDALSNTTKSVQLNMLRSGKFNVAKAYPFTELHELAQVPTHNYPLFIRIEAGHDSQGEFVQGPFNSYNELIEGFVPYNLEQRAHHQGMVAVQFIETEKIDGLYAKYRCIATKQHAIRAYAYYSSHWYIHYNNAVQNETTAALNRKFAATPFLDEEIQFFVRANATLNLDFCAYDYSIKPDGSIVLWEGNPHPGFSSMSDAEPLRSRIVQLLSDYYASFLPPLPLNERLKIRLRNLLHECLLA